MDFTIEKKKTAIADLDRTIKTLLATRNQLAQEVNSTLPLINQLAALGNNAIGTWVIIKDKNVYYQFNGVGPGTVGLMRKGEWSKVSLSTFNDKFRLATPSEVKQHLEFLGRNIHINSVTVNKLEKMISIKGEDLKAYKVLHNKPYFDPMKCDFYMVTCRGIRGAKVRHTSYELAEAEAKKIAEKENHETWIVGVVASVKPTVSYETVKKVSVQVNKR